VRPGGRADHPIELLSASIDRELKPAEAAALEAHLEGCAECRGLLNDFRRLDEAMVSEPAPPVPAGLEERILAALPARAAPSVPRPFWRQAMPLAAAASLVVAVIAWYARPDRRPPLSGTAPQEMAESKAKPAKAPADPSKATVLGRSASAPAPATNSATAPSDPAAATDHPASPAPVQARRSAVPAPSPAPSSAPQPLVADELRQATEKKAGEPPGNWKVESTAEGAADGALRLQQETAARAREAARLLEANELAPRITAAGPPAAATPAAVQIPPPVGLFAAPYVVAIETDGRMLVHRGTYNCAVPIEEDDRKVVDAALEEIVGRSDAEARPNARDSGGARVVTATPRGREAVLRLVRERYRVLLETRCGPLPG
jgi:hypothetical protein